MDYKGLHQCIYPRERAQTFSTFSKITEKVVIHACNLTLSQVSG